MTAKTVGSVVGLALLGIVGTGLAVAATPDAKVPPRTTTLTSTVTTTRTSVRTVTGGSGRTSRPSGSAGSRTVTVERTTTLMTTIRVPQARALPPGASRISLQYALAVTKRLSTVSITREYGLFNRPAYTGRIGTAVVIRTRVSETLQTCRAYIRLGRGTLVADALVSSSASFLNLAVLGGTGIYSNVMGTIAFQPISARAGIILATLEAF